MLFAGLEGGSFAPPRRLLDAHGEPLRVGRASWPCACDWDRDGDLDLVIGNMAGKVWLARNQGTATAPSFALPESVFAGAAPLELVSTNAAPCPADWDGDGAVDLLLGCGDGSVRFYRNTKKEGEAKLAPPIELVERAPDGENAVRLAHPGLRARLAVVDWNEDGKTDLVAGEYTAEDGVAPELDEAQKKELEAAMQASLELGTKRGELERAALETWLAKNKVPAEDAARKYDDFLVEWQKTPEVVELTRKQENVAAVLKRLNPQVIEHGRVWVHLRR